MSQSGNTFLPGKYLLLTRRGPIFPFFILLFLVVSLTLPVFFSQPHAAKTGRFTVVGNKIIDPNGNQFIVKGIDTIYGRFAGGDYNRDGLTNFQNADRDLDNIKAAGFNLVRLDISPSQVISHNQADEIDTIVQKVTSRGLVIILDNNDWNNPTSEASWLQTTAAIYKNNPLVWFNTGNEPFCGGTNCSNWVYWQQIESQWVRAIRAGGNQNPIIVNCVGWSWDCSQVDSYPLGDTNIVYGAHRYANGETSFGQSSISDIARSWGNLSNHLAVIVDEVGNEDVGSENPGGSIAWDQEFATWLTDWSNNNGGSGAIAFVDAWSDGNTMINKDGSWNQWGQTFINYFVKKIVSKNLLSPTKPRHA